MIPAGFNVNCAISNVQYSPLTDVTEQMGKCLGTEKSFLLAYLKHIKHTDDCSAHLQGFTQVHVRFDALPCVLVIAH